MHGLLLLGTACYPLHSPKNPHPSFPIASLPSTVQRLGSGRSRTLLPCYPGFLTCVQYYCEKFHLMSLSSTRSPGLMIRRCHLKIINLLSVPHLQHLSLLNAAQPSRNLSDLTSALNPNFCYPYHNGELGASTSSEDVIAISCSGNICEHGIWRFLFSGRPATHGFNEVHIKEYGRENPAKR
jgi:hypothetical protein